MNAHCFFVFLALYGTSAVSPVEAEDAQRGQVVIFAGYQASYRAAADSLQAALKHENIVCLFIEFHQDPARKKAAIKKLVDANPAIIAAGGSTATATALEYVPGVPVVAFMIPNALDAPFMVKDSVHRSRLACVASDVLPEEQMAWISKFDSRGKVVGVLYSARSERTVASLQAAAQKRGIQIAKIAARKKNFADAIEALNDQGCDSALMIPDARVYNSTNVQRLLLWGIRQKKPVWAFSANVVKAGALAGQFSESESVGRQTAGLVQRILNGTDIADIGLQFSRKIKSAVNLRTADMIGISLTPGRLGAETERFGATQ